MTEPTTTVNLPNFHSKLAEANGQLSTLIVTLLNTMQYDSYPQYKRGIYAIIIQLGESGIALTAMLDELEKQDQNVKGIINE